MFGQVPALRLLLGVSRYRHHEETRRFATGVFEQSIELFLLFLLSPGNLLTLVPLLLFGHAFITISHPVCHERACVSLQLQEKLWVVGFKVFDAQIW